MCLACISLMCVTNRSQLVLASRAEQAFKKLPQNENDSALTASQLALDHSEILHWGFLFICALMCLSTRMSGKIFGYEKVRGILWWMPAIIFSCDKAALWMVISVCPSVCLPVTPFWLCSHHRIIMKFSGFITKDQDNVHAKDQGQRLKVKVTKVTTELDVSGL